MHVPGREKFHDQGVDFLRRKNDLGHKDDLAVFAKNNRMTTGNVHVGHTFGNAAFNKGSECIHGVMVDEVMENGTDNCAYGSGTALR
jgi:hypothetical protein